MPLRKPTRALAVALAKQMARVVRSLTTAKGDCQAVAPA